jgi:hypothetical protein
VIYNNFIAILILSKLICYPRTYRIRRLDSFPFCICLMVELLWSILIILDTLEINLCSLKACLLSDDRHPDSFLSCKCFSMVVVVIFYSLDLTLCSRHSISLQCASQTCSCAAERIRRRVRPANKQKTRKGHMPTRQTPTYQLLYMGT